MPKEQIIENCIIINKDKFKKIILGSFTSDHDSAYFCGYQLGFSCIERLLKRNQRIRDYKQPKNKKALQRFLGMLNYDEMFVKNVAGLLDPLYKMLEKDANIVWIDELDMLFSQIKKIWRKDCELKIPYLKRLFTRN